MPGETVFYKAHPRAVQPLCECPFLAHALNIRFFCSISSFIETPVENVQSGSTWISKSIDINGF